MHLQKSSIFVMFITCIFLDSYNYLYTYYLWTYRKVQHLLCLLSLYITDFYNYTYSFLPLTIDGSDYIAFPLPRRLRHNTNTGNVRTFACSISSMLGLRWPFFGPLAMILSSLFWHWTAKWLNGVYNAIINNFLIRSSWCNILSYLEK